MRGFVPLDPDAKVSAEHFAVVYVPRRSRNRFPSGCVEIVETEQEAIKGGDESNKRYPARVIGPSKSSEGQLMYYLVHWL